MLCCCLPISCQTSVCACVLQTVVTVVILTFLLVGGYYVRSIPIWIGWIRYISFIYWGFNLLLKIQFRCAWLCCLRLTTEHTALSLSTPSGVFALPMTWTSLKLSMLVSSSSSCNNALHISSCLCHLDLSQSMPGPVAWHVVHSFSYMLHHLNLSAHTTACIDPLVSGQALILLSCESLCLNQRWQCDYRPQASAASPDICAPCFWSLVSYHLFDSALTHLLLGLRFLQGLSVLPVQHKYTSRHLTGRSCWHTRLYPC